MVIYFDFVLKLPLFFDLNHVGRECIAHGVNVPLNGRGAVNLYFRKGFDNDESNSRLR